MEEKRNCTNGACNHLKGVRCDVESCYYNDCAKHCTANEIAVGPHGADTSGETLCVTFKPKGE